MSEAVEVPDDDNRLVEVCDKCFRACCWQGVFMCDRAYDAGTGTTMKPISFLKELGEEHSDYWKLDRM